MKPAFLIYSGLIFLMVSSFFDAKSAEDDETIRLMWQVIPPKEKIKEICDLRKFGITHIQSFRLLNKEERYINEYLKVANSCNLKVIAYIGHTWELPDSQLQIKKIISKWGKSGIDAWQIFDEPYGRKISLTKVKLAVDFMRTQSNTKLFISNNSVKKEDIDNFIQSIDVDLYEFHRYINPVLSKKQVEMANTLTKFKTKKVIISLRAFNSPHKRRRLTTKVDAMRNEALFYKRLNFKNFGFYGWNLSPNTGINSSAFLLNEFKKTVEAIDAAY